MEDTGRNTLKRNSWNFSASKNFKGKLKAEIFKARIKKEGLHDLCCKQLLKIIKNIIFFLIFSTEYDIIFLKIRENAMNHLD